MTAEPRIIELDGPRQRLFRPLVVIAASVLLVGPVLILISFVFALWVLISRDLQIPSVLTGLGVGLLIAAVVAFAVWLWKRQIRSIANHVRESRGQPCDERARSLLLSNRYLSAQAEIERVAALAADGVAHVVVLRGQARTINRTPIEVPFEPTPLDESAPAFGDLHGVENHPLPPTASRTESRLIRMLGRLPPLWRRRLALGPGWLAIFYLLVYVVPGGIDALRSRRVSFSYAVWLSLFLLVAFGLGGFGAWRASDQWFVVPGAIVRRVTRRRRDSWDLHLFARSDSLLSISETSITTYRICVADKSQRAAVDVTRDEAELLLRAWLSPLPPPRIEQLSDLE